MGVSSSKSKGAKKVGKGQITEVDQAVLKLKTMRRKVQAERARLEKLMDASTEVAKRLLKEGRKDRALTAIKRKKLVEHQAATADGWLLNVEEQLASIETAQGQAGVFAALKSGVDAVKEIQKEASIENVEALLDELSDAAANQAAVDELLAQSLGDGLDEDALAHELADLEAAALKKEMEAMPDAPAVPEDAQRAAEAAAAAAAAAELPDVPTHVAGEQATQEAEEEPQAIPA